MCGCREKVCRHFLVYRGTSHIYLARSLAGRGGSIGPSRTEPRGAAPARSGISLISGMTFLRKAWQRGRDLLPVSGFHFDRPIVLLQSDDWGRVGLRDQEGLEELQAAGLTLGDRPYDFYTLETAENLSRLADVV